jgi:hypothetical protein
MSKPSKMDLQNHGYNMLLKSSTGFSICHIGTSSTNQCAGAHIKGLYHHQYNFWDKKFTFI